MTRTRKPGVSRRATLAMMGAGAVTFATPWVARAQAKTIKVGMPTILSGRVAQLGTSSRNGVMLEVFEENFDRKNLAHAEIMRSSIAKNHLLWLPPAFLRTHL